MYLYQETLNIANNMEKILPAGYTAFFELDTSVLIADGKLSPSCNDLRVYYYNGSATVEIKRHIREHTFACGSTTTKVWFNTQKDIVPSETDSDYYLFYGNTTIVEPLESDSSIYVFMDDFTSTERFTELWRNNINGTLHLSFHNNSNYLTKSRLDSYGGYVLIGSELSQFELTAVFRYTSASHELNDAINIGMTNENMLGYVGSVRMKNQIGNSFSIKKAFSHESLSETAAAGNHPEDEWITVTLRKPSTKIRLLSSAGDSQLNSITYAAGSQYDSFDRVVLYGDASIYVHSIYVRKIETSEPFIWRSDAASSASSTYPTLYNGNCTLSKIAQRSAPKKRKVSPRLFTCNGLAPGNPDVCSGHGDCNSWALFSSGCDCDSGYSGNDCQNWYCNGVLYSSSSACSSNGTCTAPNVCACKTGFTGAYCASWNCNSTDRLASSVCSSNGSCTAPNSCLCKSGYSGTNCENFYCNGVKYNNDTGCSFNGTCVSPSTCNCKSGFYGSACQNWNCSSIAMNSTSVCSGNGRCTSPNACSCTSDYSGSKCDLLIKNCVPGFYGNTCEQSKFYEKVLTRSVEHF
jgi:hypothetical protein